MPKKIIRKPAVAGKFYPGTSKALKEIIKSFIDKSPNPADVIACMLPHAGYVYSGMVAGAVLSSIKIKKTVILLGPNHTGKGLPFSIMTEGAWQTPLGETEINSNLAEKLLKGSAYLKEDILAHQDEHSLEVELPFLQYLEPNIEIVPILFGSDDFKDLQQVGLEIARTLKDAGLSDSVLLVASSDMTHYEPQRQAEQKDKLAIEAILNLDEKRLAQNIVSFDISMCGYAPAIVMLSAAKALGAKNAKLIRYQTSGDVTGDKDTVVGYAGITIF